MRRRQPTPAPPKKLPPLRSVGELKRYLASEEISPEALSKRVHISNMTIRRLLSRGDITTIPERYQAQFDLLAATPLRAAKASVGVSEVKPLFNHLRKLADEGELRPKELSSAARGYLGVCKMASAIRPMVKNLSAVVIHSRTRSDVSLATGALLYFLLPFDFIPDMTLVTGFLDDYAVLSLVENWLETHSAIEAAKN